MLPEAGALGKAKFAVARCTAAELAKKNRDCSLQSEGVGEGAGVGVGVGGDDGDLGR